ncbi:MAG: hypothetical protein AB8F95_07965 [Bacteroidia bacterium]
MDPFLTQLLIAAALLLFAVLLGIWIGSLRGRKYKNLAEEWEREYHEKLETYTNLQEAHDTLNVQYTKDREAISGLQAKISNSVSERSQLELQLGELRQQLEHANQQAANAREEATQAIQKAEAQVEEFEQRETKQAIEVPAVPEPAKVVSAAIPKVSTEPVTASERQRLAELENSIGRLKNQILLLMPFQGKFERALKEMEQLKRDEKAALDRAARAKAAAKVSQKAMAEAAGQVQQLESIKDLYGNSQDQIHKLNLALGIVRPYKEKAEKLEKRTHTLENRIKKLEAGTEAKATSAKRPARKSTPKPAAKKEAPKAPAKKPASKPVAKKSAPKPVAKKEAPKPKARPPKKTNQPKATNTKPNTPKSGNKPAAKTAAPKKNAAAKPASKPKPTRKATKAETLARIKAKASEVDFDRIGKATASQRDDLKKIKGIGPFLEEKLNSIGIYNFEQISRFTPGIEKKVNEIIEFFPGRIKRDKWKNQAAALFKAKNKR